MGNRREGPCHPQLAGSFGRAAVGRSVGRGRRGRGHEIGENPLDVCPENSEGTVYVRARARRAPPPLRREQPNH